MTNLSDEILTAFLDKQVLTLKDSDISLSLVAQGIQCYIEDVRRHVQSLSPSLFQISFSKSNSMTIQVDPKIDICREFLAGRCHNSVKPCGKLHICRRFGHCTMPNCRYAHDFTRGENRKIVEQYNCQNIDSQLLVRLIRLKNGLQSSRPNANRRNAPVSQQRQAQAQEPEQEQDNSHRQVDISYPSIDRARQIDMEIIEMILNTQGITIEKKFDECQNDYFRRTTIQLKHTDDVEKLVNLTKISRDNYDIKFKRTDQSIDRTSFILKTSINNFQDKISESRIKLYVSLLVGSSVLFTIHDLSSENEQISLVHCNNDIDFDKVQQQYQTKRQLQNKDISLMQIYECDTVMIRFIDENRSMRYVDIENILSSVQDYIFTFEVNDQNLAEVEFINTNAYNQWMSTIDRIKTKFQVTVTPDINTVDENETSSSSAQNIPFDINSSVTNKPPVTTIKLRPDWAMVAAHPLFQREYRDYIREQLGAEIEINGDTVTCTGDLPRLACNRTNESVLANKTNNYMQTLKYDKLRNLRPYHINILRAHSTNVAYTRSSGNDYSVAAKSQDLYDLKSKLFPKSKQHSQPDHPYPLMTQPSDDRPSTASVPLLRQERIDKPSGAASMPQMPLSSSIYPITSSEQISMFSLKTFEDRLQQHLTDTFNVKTLIERNTINDKSKSEKSRIMIKITGYERNVENALNDLSDLFALFRTRKFDDKTDGNWTKIDDAIHVIQHHFTINDLICTCQKIASTIVYVNYFDLTSPQFGVDVQKIEDLINDQFSLATIVYNSQSIASKFNKEWTDLENNIRSRDDYKKDICLYNETNLMYLFGLTQLVKKFRQNFEELKNKYIPQTCQIKLTTKQLHYLNSVGKNDLNKLEKQYKSDGCDLSLTRLRQGDFLAPPDLHSKIKDSIDTLVQIDEITFEIKNSAFEVLISKEPERLLSIVKSKCYLDKQVKTQQVFISVPNAQVIDQEDPPQKPQDTSATNATSVNIGNATITIALGDLTTQAVDMIVVCSTSEVLRKAIIAQAGTRVQTEYDAYTSNNHQAFTTSNGSLPCKKIMFLPWKSDSSDTSSLKTSLSTFVSTAIAHASKKGYQTIAFPSVGCGKLGFDPSIIAKHMIDEAYQQLLVLDSTMTVSFVLVPSQQNVYDEFVKYLNTLQPRSSTIPKTPSTKKTTTQSKIPYEEKIVQITLISSNNNHLIKCKNDIIELSESSLYTKRLTDKNDMIDWSQKTIEQYYTYCLKQHVIPKLDFDTCTLELVGPKEAVHEAEKHFYEVTTETFKEARINAISRGVIWSAEITPGSDNWEQYSYKLNGTIEDAYSKKLQHIDFVNDKQERCRIVFQLLQEQHGTDVRSIRRKVVDSLLPAEWTPSNQNCARVPLPSTSKEYQHVLQQFNTTMKGHYTQIISIERIQNERWYKQYAAHRDEYKQRYGKLDERLLFHGCLGPSANQIIQECFNRSFAGVNGVVYGCGVYFHDHASYSHQYAKPSATGERTMFLARVLIGKTCAGNQSMKVPPPGHDTTTDGKHIFVIYHDAGAYADHLITYK